MIKKTVTYKDFNGTERTETHHFHLSKSEIVDMELTTDGGLSDKLQRIVDSNSTPEIVKIFKDFILKSYGKISDDGRSFIKEDPETGAPLARAFAQTAAFDALYMGFIQNADDAAAFINGIIPQDIADEIAKENGSKLTVVKSDAAE